MVKRANQRFRQLEKSNMTYSSAYKYMINQLKADRKYLTTDNKGRIKFRTDTSKLKKESASSFNALVRNVEEFLNANTSTVKGVKNQYIKGFETFRNSESYVEKRVLTRKILYRISGADEIEIGRASCLKEY